MKIIPFKDMKDGWFIGDFDPSVYKTKDFEVAFKTHKKGSYHAPHHHKVATEYNLLIEGSIDFSGKIVNEGEIFIFEPNESSIPIFLTDCKLVVIKTPSVLGDKYND